MKLPIWKAQALGALVAFAAASLSCADGDGKAQAFGPKGGIPIILSERILHNASDDYLLFLKQLGLSHVDVVLGRGAEHDREALVGIAERLRAEGFELGSINNHAFWTRRADPIFLGGEGREELAEEHLRFLKDAAAAGFRSELISWRPSKLSYGERPRGLESRGARTVGRAYDPDAPQELAYGRRYTAEEMWENFAWWAQRAMPVAEEAGISLGVHQNAGIPEVGGVANPFHSRACYERAIRIADSPRFGLTLCIGVWATSPELYGDVAEAIRHFGGQQRIFHVHFRNIDAPLPVYKETFLDNGYVDMHEAMKALWETNFDGTVIPDHSPSFVHGGIAPGGVGIGAGTGTAYAVAYMRAIVIALEKGWGQP